MVGALVMGFMPLQKRAQSAPSSFLPCEDRREDSHL